MSGLRHFLQRFSARPSGATATPTVPRQQFVAAALAGPATAKISWREVGGLLVEVADTIKQTRPDVKVASLLYENAATLCPSCNLMVTYNRLGMLEFEARMGGGAVLASGTSGVIKGGHCPNRGCSSADVLLLWNPAGNQSLMARLRENRVKYLEDEGPYLTKLGIPLG